MKVQAFYNDVVLTYRGPDCLLWPYSFSGNGYAQMRTIGTNNVVRVHRLACEAIHGPPPSKKHQAAHSCGNKICVNPHHLSWKTRAENEADKVIHGTSNRGDRCGTSKLTESQAREILSLKGKETPKSIAARYGVSLNAIWDIHSGRRWAWLEREREFDPAPRRRQYSAVAVGASL